MLPDIEVWQDLIADQIPSTANAVASGAVQFDDEQTFVGGGTTVAIPHLESLDQLINPVPQRISSADGDDVTPSRISGYNELAPVKHWSDALEIRLSETIQLGLDPRDTYQPQVGTAVAGYFEYWLSYMLKAVFDPTAGALRTTHLDQYTTEHLSLQIVNKSKAKQNRFSSAGGDDLNILFVHSDVQAQASNDGYSTTVPAPVGAMVAQDGFLTKIGTATLVRNNVLCAPITVDGNTIYPSYLCGVAAMWAGYKKALQIWRDEVPLKNGRRHLLQWAGASSVGLRGVSWSAGSIQNPTDTQLGTAANWEKAAPDQLIRIRRIETTVDPM